MAHAIISNGFMERSAAKHGFALRGIVKSNKARKVWLGGQWPVAILLSIFPRRGLRGSALRRIPWRCSVRSCEDANGVIDMSNRKNKKNRERRHALRIAKKVAKVVAKEVGVSVKKARITILPMRSK